MSLPANRSSEAIQAALAVQQMSCAWRASSPLPIGDRHLGLRRLGAPTCSPMELQPSTVVERSCKASGAATGLPASPRHPEHARVTLHGRQRAAGTLAMRSAEFGASLRRHLRDMCKSPSAAFVAQFAPVKSWHQLKACPAHITQFVHGTRILLLARVGVYRRFVNGTASATRAPCGQSP